MDRSVNSARPRRKPRGQFHHGDLRAALLQAAEQLVARNGHESLTLREAAHAVGVSEPAVYRHFASRDALLAAVGLRGYERFTTACIEAAKGAGGEPVTALAAALRTYVRFAAHNPYWFRLWFSRRWNEDIAGDDVTMRQQSVEPLMQMLRVALVDEAPIEDLFRMLWGLAHGLAGLVVERVFQLVDSDAERLDAADQAIFLAVDAVCGRWTADRTSSSRC